MNQKPIILLSASDSHGNLTKLADEFQTITDALKQAKDLGVCQIEYIYNITPNNLFKVFNENKNNIIGWHYAGHASEKGIQVFNEMGEPITLSSENLNEYLNMQQNLRFVFFNACHSFAALESLNIPVVIGTNVGIGDDIALKFASRFYQELGKGETIEQASNSAKFFTLAENSNNKDAIARGITGWNKKRIELFSHRALVFNWSLFDETHLIPLPVPPYTIPSSPFVGLRYYTKKEAQIFLGRNEEIKNIKARLLNPSTQPIMLLCGMSGVGKSSLIEAGIIPRIENEFSIVSYRLNYSDIRHIFETEFDTTALLNSWLQKEQELDKPFLLIIDQFEELFLDSDNLNSNKEKQQLLMYIKSLYENETNQPKGKILLSFRKEYLAEIRQWFKSIHINHAPEIIIEPFKRKQIIQLISNIVDLPNDKQSNLNEIKKVYNIRVDSEGLIEKIADDLLQSDLPISPTLQLILSEMWDAVIDKEDRIWSVELYQSVKNKTLYDFMKNKLAELYETYPNEHYDKTGVALLFLKKHITQENLSCRYSSKQIINDFKQVDKIENILNWFCKFYIIYIKKQEKEAKLQENYSYLGHDTLVHIINRLYQESNGYVQQTERILLARTTIDTKNTSLLNEEEMIIVMEAKKWICDWNNIQMQKLIQDSLLNNKRIRQRKLLINISGIVFIIVFTLGAGSLINASFLWFLLLIIVANFIDF